MVNVKVTDFVTRLDSLTPHDLMNLNGPKSALKGADAEGYRKVAEYFYGLWVELLNGTLEFKDEYVEYNCGRCDLVHKYGTEAANTRLLMIIGSFYGFVSHNLVMARSNTAGVDIPGCEVDDYQAVRDGKGTSQFEWSRKLLASYIEVIQSSRVLYLVRTGNLQADYIVDAMERSFAHSVIDVYHFFADELTAELVPRHGMEGSYLTRQLLGYCLHLQSSVFSWPARPWSEGHAAGVFSSLKLPELQLLASRADEMKVRYGEHRVDKVFEQQLALVAQSLGFYVVETRRGERSVDLLCVSSDPSASYTMLIEAKSTSRPYALPTKDERALKEYINEVKGNLITSPPLDMVLLVGPRASKTLEQKLRKMEADVGISVRFCTAQTLASLRERVLGPLPLGLLRKYFRNAGHCVADDVVDKLVATLVQREAAQQQLVRAFLLDSDEND